MPPGAGVRGPEKRPRPEIVKFSFRIDPWESENPCKGLLFLMISLFGIDPFGVNLEGCRAPGYEKHCFLIVCASI